MTFSKSVAFTRQDLYFYYCRNTSVVNTSNVPEKVFTVIESREKVMEILKKYDSENYDVCKASYLNHFIKFSYITKGKVEYKEIYEIIKKKIKDNKKGI